MFFPDLGKRCQIASGPRVRAVGWLARGESFTRGPCPAELVPALERLARQGWVPFCAAGFHECELCEGEPHREGANILLPAGDLLYAAPAMVAHYIEAHGYRPPDGFIEAALACPPPRTREYIDTLRPFISIWAPHISEKDLEFNLRRGD